MPLFSLPLDSSTVRSSTRAHLYPRSSKKRKRPSSPHVDFDESKLVVSPPTAELSSLPAASTNPLSLTPDDIHQYRVAGLDLDQELPWKFVSDFPHRGLPPSFPYASHVDTAAQTGDEGVEIENKQTHRKTKAPHLRMQHLGVLSTILHWCLLEGDIPRASRAWAMLLRAQVNGKGIDIRSSGYWGVGAELLIRSGEKKMRRRKVWQKDDTESSESDAEDREDGDEAETGEDPIFGESERRWGTASGLEKAKDYYERLMLQHPYKRQYHDSVNSLDFWPAMLSCEIYGIQFEQKEALRKASAEEESDDVAIADVSSEEGENTAMNDPDVYFAAQQRREQRQRDYKRETLWKRREEIRQTALVASEKIAARMDELMTTPPFSDSHVLQRLRGMLALYIGDLSVPTLLGGEDNNSEDLDESGDDRRSDWSSADEKLAESRLLERQRRAEHDRGLEKRAEEVERARKAFEKVKKDGGRIDAEIGRLAL